MAREQQADKSSGVEECPHRAMVVGSWKSDGLWADNPIENLLVRDCSAGDQKAQEIRFLDAAGGSSRLGGFVLATSSVPRPASEPMSHQRASFARPSPSAQKLDRQQLFSASVPASAALVSVPRACFQGRVGSLLRFQAPPLFSLL